MVSIRRHGLAGSFAPGPYQAAVRHWPGHSVVRDSNEKSITSKHLQVGGRIHVLKTVGLRSPFYYWLLGLISAFYGYAQFPVM